VPDQTLPGQVTSAAGWTVDTLREYTATVQRLEDKFQAERDRRYKEVAEEREKALKIKETADLAALSLAREIQDYKDEKANNLRSQIEGERGHYATKDDLKVLGDKLEAAVKPMNDFIAGQRGNVAQRESARQLTSIVISALALLVIMLGYYATTHHHA
jgi:hypothetical protein